MSLLLGCIADDVTGATDLANTLVREGMRTVQLLGVPSGPPPADIDAIVVALKSRTIPADDAIRQSLESLKWLQGNGARQILFKYCSTFDSTAEGNIGPVADALLDEMGADFTIFCPAFPENGRTICHGYLFVGEVLLSESGMRDHPLTPMTDPSLVRVLQAQTPGKVGLVRYDTVAAGAARIYDRYAALREEGYRHAIVDALSDADLRAIGAGSADLALITGGSGIALGLPENFRRAGLLGEAADADALPAVDGTSAVLAGSCSLATQAQVKAFGGPSMRLDPLALADGSQTAQVALDWAGDKLGDGPVLIYATADAEAVKQAQAKLGRERAGAVVEEAMGTIATGLAERGVRKLVVAGGETAGAVVAALDVKGLRIGPQIDPGVPWTLALGDPQIALALKSGNFGGPDFFAKALGMLESTNA